MKSKEVGTAEKKVFNFDSVQQCCSQINTSTVSVKPADADPSSVKPDPLFIRTMELLR